MVAVGMLAVTMLFAGALADTWNRKRTMSIALFTSALLVLASAAAPDLDGLATAVAQADIIAAGFPVGTITSGPSTEADLNLVIEQTPEAGAVVPLTTKINFVLGAGPPTPGPPVLEVPSVEGQTQLQLNATVAAVGMGVGTNVGLFTS